MKISDWTASLVRSRPAASRIAPPRTNRPAGSLAVRSRGAPRPPRSVPTPTVERDRVARRAGRAALERFIGKVPALAQHGSAPTTPASPTIINYAGSGRQFTTPVSNPTAAAAAIIVSGWRGRAGLGSSRPAPTPTGLAGQIVAAGKKRRGEI